MNKKLIINFFAIILIFVCPASTSVMKFSAEFQNETPGVNHEDLWHPHLKKKWISDKESVVFDHRSKVYPTNLSLIQSQSTTTTKTPNADNISVIDQDALQNLLNNPKMSCGCKFIKEDSGTSCKTEEEKKPTALESGNVISFIQKKDEQLPSGKRFLSKSNKSINRSFQNQDPELHSSLTDRGVEIPNNSNLQHLLYNSPSLNPINPNKVFLNANLNSYLNRLNMNIPDANTLLGVQMEAEDLLSKIQSLKSLAFMNNINMNNMNSMSNLSNINNNINSINGYNAMNNIGMNNPNIQPIYANNFNGGIGQNIPIGGLNSNNMYNDYGFNNRGIPNVNMSNNFPQNMMMKGVNGGNTPFINNLNNDIYGMSALQLNNQQQQFNPYSANLRQPSIPYF